MFSVAVSVPYNKDKNLYDMSKVLDSSQAVRDTILRCDVYVGQRVVAATVLRWPNVLQQCPTGRVQWPDLLRQCGRNSMTWAEVKRDCPDKIKDGRADHAEYRTLEKFSALVSNHKNFSDDLLIFYVLASPCDQRCTSETNIHSILDLINPILKWKKYAFVFTNVFQPRNGPRIPEANLREALERLAKHKGSLGSLGLSNIFRCKARNQMQCTSCNRSGKVDRYCYSDKSDRRDVVPSRTNRVKV